MTTMIRCRLACAVLLVVWSGLVQRGAAAEQTNDQLGRKKSKTRNAGAKVEIGPEGFKVESADGDFELRLGGRLQMDAAFHDQDTSRLGDGTEIRRARIYLKGKVFQKWGYKAQFELSDGNASIRDMYLRYKTDGKTTITVGNFKEPFSLEDQGSSKDITFLERSLPVAAFAPSRALGVGVHKSGNTGSLAFGLFGEPISESIREVRGFGIAGRGTWAPFNSKEGLLHLGLAVEYREPRVGEEIRFDARPESSITSDRLVRTSRLGDIESTDRFGVEMAYRARNISAQSEYLVTRIARSARPGAELSGWYAYASWFPTGESRPYDVGEGTFGRPKPLKSRGAWEVAVRLSSLDLDDADIEGGRAENMTLALNWYPNHNVRLMANYVLVDSVRRGETDDPAILLARAQIVF